MPFITDYRPKTFDEVVGNEATVHSLKSLLSKPNPPKSFLLHGPTGCGKTTLGRLIADALHCSDKDYTEVDAADFRGIDTVREIRRQMSFRPMGGPSRVWLLDECHALSSDAMTALLKALEDPPSHAYFILCTTDPQKLLPTIRGRCSEHAVAPLTDGEMLRLLRSVVRAEGSTLPRDAYQQITESSRGLPRTALALLEKILCLPEDQQVEAAKVIADEQTQVIELCRALLNPAAGWKKVRTILAGLQDQDPESIRRQILGYFSAVLVKEENDHVASVIEEFLEPLYNTGRAGLIYACYAIVRRSNE